MSRGYAGKWLDIDLTKEKIDDITFPEKTLYQYFGGRGLAAKVLWDRLGKKWAKVDPLGPENILTILTGPLTALHGGSRISVSGKSPLSNGTVGSTASTEFAAELKCAGYDGVFVSGRASGPVYLLITDDGAEIMDAAHLWGKIGEDTLKMLNAEVRKELTRRKPGIGLWKEPSMIYIGPAGENLIRNAAVMTKIAHACGYGGYGAVMGSKKLKAVVAKGRGPLPGVYAPKTVETLLHEYHQQVISGGALGGSSLRRWGTGYGGWSVGAVSSSEPVRNWQEEWHDERSMGGPRFSTRFWVKSYWSDFNCSKSCMKISCIKTGRWKGDITDMPDYEIEAYCGPNLGIFNPEDIIHLCTIMDNLGMSGINTANTMGFAAELYQRGILTRDDLGFDLNWGDAEAFTKLAWLMVNREKIGDLLAEGTYRAALKISEIKGVDVIPYAVHVKAVEVGAHGLRSGKEADYHDISYACSAQGGDHTSSIYLDFKHPFYSLFIDSAVVCMFCFLPDLVWDFAQAVTGWTITKDKWFLEFGQRVTTLERGLVLIGGPDVFWNPVKDDDNPPRFYEPLPSGPYQGRTTDKTLVEKRKQEFYTNMGWDEMGIPTKETLVKLSLGDLEREMEKCRKASY